MASATAKPQKRLGDFLNEQQEPFILEVYLIERDYSKGWRLSEGCSSKSLEKSASFGLNNKRNRKALFPFCRVLTTLLNKLAFHSQSTTFTRDYDQRKKHASVNEPGCTNPIVQFSSAGSSSLINSCSHVDEEGSSLSSHKDQHSFSSHIHQNSNVCNTRWQRRRCVDSSPESLGNIPSNVREDVGGMQHRIRSCDVLMPEKIAENSLLSVAIWNLIGPPIKKEDCTKELQEFVPGTDVSQVLRSKRVSHKINKLLYDCVRDNMITLPIKDDRKQGCRQLMGPLEVGKLICQRTKEWDQHTGDGVNLTQLLTKDYLDSIIQWCNFEPCVNDIAVEITDAILECMNNEIVSEMIETLAPKKSKKTPLWIIDVNIYA